MGVVALRKGWGKKRARTTPRIFTFACQQASLKWMYRWTGNTKSTSSPPWNQHFMTDLERARELEIAIFWRDWRSMSALKFIRLEDFLDNKRHGMAVHLEPKGILFIEVTFSNPKIERRPKLQRQ